MYDEVENSLFYLKKQSNYNAVFNLFEQPMKRYDAPKAIVMTTIRFYDMSVRRIGMFKDRK